MTAAPSGHGKCGAAVRGEGLLQHVRFSLIDSKFLSEQALMECVQGPSKLLELIRHASGISSDSSDTTEGCSKRARLCRGTDCVELFMNKECVKSRWDAGEQAFSIAAVGRGFVCGPWSGKIKLWKSDDQRYELQLVGHTMVVTAVVWWGNLIVSGSLDGRILVWNSQTGLCEAVLLGHARGLSGLPVCGSRLLSGSDDGTVRVWGLLGPPEHYMACAKTPKRIRSGVFSVYFKIGLKLESYKKLQNFNFCSTTHFCLSYRLPGIEPGSTA